MFEYLTDYFTSKALISLPFLIMLPNGNGLPRGRTPEDLEYSMNTHGFKIDDLTRAPFQGNLTVYVHVVERRSVNWEVLLFHFFLGERVPAHQTHGLRSRYGTPVERVNMCDHMLNKCANNIRLCSRTSFNTIDEQTHRFGKIQLHTANVQ
jgi:hypothetical protein